MTKQKQSSSEIFLEYAEYEEVTGLFARENALRQSQETMAIAWQDVASDNLKRKQLWWDRIYEKYGLDWDKRYVVRGRILKEMPPEPEPKQPRPGAQKP